MAKNLFSLRDFLRNVPDDLLREFCHKQKVLIDIDFSNLSKKDRIETLVTEFNALSEEKQQEIERIFLDVQDMSHEPGIKTLIEEGKYHEKDLASELIGLDGFQAKLLRVYLDHPTVFEVAALLNHSDSLGRRSWKVRSGLPKNVSPQVEDAAMREFEAALKAFYEPRESRGKRCHVDPYLRGNIHYFFAFPEDYASSASAFNTQNELVRKTFKPTFEIIFRYEPANGVLKLYAIGKPDAIEKLQEIFCRVILQCKLPPRLPKSHPFELDQILSRNFELPIEPVDQIDHVLVRRLRLSLTEANTQRIILEVAAEAEMDDMRKLYHDYLNHVKIAAQSQHVTQAEFEFEFLVKGKRKPKKIVFQVSYPDSENLGGVPEAYRATVEKYLKRWGIYRA